LKSTINNEDRIYIISQVIHPIKNRVRSKIFRRSYLLWLEIVIYS